MRAMHELKAPPRLDEPTGEQRMHRAHSTAHRVERPDLHESCSGRPAIFEPPTLRKGRTLIVGFDEATYKRVLG